MSEDIGWHRCPECLGVLELLDDGNVIVPTCSQCGHTGERLAMPDATRPANRDLPSFNGF